MIQEVHHGQMQQTEATNEISQYYKEQAMNPNVKLIALLYAYFSIFFL
jgi:hypothetical protein